MKRVITRIVLAALVAATALSSPGCVVNRIHALRDQSCEFDRNFEVARDNGVSIRFQDPVLLYDDVVFLVGIAPEISVEEGDRVVANYVLKKRGDAEFESIPIDLEFRHRERELVLTRLSAQSPLLASLQPMLLPRLSSDNCNTSLPLRTRIEVPIPDFDRSIIPGRMELIELLGRLESPGVRNGKLAYRFFLEGADGEQLPVLFAMEYDGLGKTLLRMQTQFHRYVAGADFETGWAWGTIAL